MAFSTVLRKHSHMPSHKNVTQKASLRFRRLKRNSIPYKLSIPYKKSFNYRLRLTLSCFFKSIFFAFMSLLPLCSYPTLSLRLFKWL